MANSSNGKPKSSSSNTDWKDRYHVINLSPRDEKDCIDWVIATKPNWTSCVEQMVEDGWSVKITPPNNNSNYVVSFTGKCVDTEYDDNTYSVYYPDLEGCVLVAFYVAEVWRENGRLPSAGVKKTEGFLSKIV